MNRMDFQNDSTEKQNSKNDIDLARFATRLLRKRRIIIGLVLAVMLTTAGRMLSIPNEYTSVATVLPSGKTANFGALQAMIGMAGSSLMVEENSSVLYPLILNSKLVQDGVLNRTYRVTTENGVEDVRLTEYFDVTDHDKLHEALSAATAVKADGRTGEIRLSVETLYPDLSQAILEQYLVELENFNQSKRQSSAVNNQKYLAARLTLAEHSLEAAEDALVAFRFSNANWAEGTDPLLLIEQQRLVREVEIRSHSFVLLTEQHELARFEAQKDIPVIRILDNPSLPTEKSGPYRSIIVLTSGAVTFAILLFWIVGLDLVRQALRNGSEVSADNFTSELRETYPRLLKIKRITERLGKKAETISMDN